MPQAGKARGAMALSALILSLPPRADEELLIWRLRDGSFESPTSKAPSLLPVGSLLKPFVAEAWARAHPGKVPPRIHCSGCWQGVAHGVVDLPQALRVSCNTYFRTLAAETPPEILEATLENEGFRVPHSLSPETAIGLPAGEPALIGPEALLQAYVRMTRTPWASGEPVRQQVLAGMREAALSGTANGLGHRGYWAKTGTVAALDATPLATSGFSLAVDDSGWAILALLPHGTGKEAARQLSAPLGRMRPWASTTLPQHDLAPSERRVRVGLFEALAPHRLTARNLGTAGQATSRGFVGPGGTLKLEPGDHLNEGLWEIELPEYGFTRRLYADLRCEASGKQLRLKAEMSAREYVSGVLAAELPSGEGDLRIQLGAAALRFIKAGPRHRDRDFCDTTHCAWFVGRGPRYLWPSPKRPALATGPVDPPLEDGLWSAIVAAYTEDGPSQWTAHCGGEPLSAHFVWGNGDRKVRVCARHSSPTRPWTRRWEDAAVARAFGDGTLHLHERDGVWTLEVEGSEGRRLLRYDEVHRRIAAVLGWDALPSPASRVVRVQGGYRVQGVGWGHRVGLCLNGSGPALD